MLRQAEKVIIACYLIDEGLDGRSVAGFLEALEAGVAAGETDAVRMRDEFGIRPSAGLPGGELGKVVAAMKALDELNEREQELERICSELCLLDKLVSFRPAHDLAARVAIRRVMELSGSR